MCKIKSIHDIDRVSSHLEDDQYYFTHTLKTNIHNSLFKILIVKLLD